MNPEFVPRYPGHEPPAHFAEIAEAMARRFEAPCMCRSGASTPLAPPPADPAPKKEKSYGFEFRAIEIPKQKRKPREYKSRIICPHSMWRRVRNSATQARCARCRLLREVTDAEREAMCPQAREGGQTRPITHGRSGYFRGCRCEVCKRAESEHRAEKYQAKIALKRLEESHV